MRILYLVIARGGSKSIPRKNLAKIEGLSLVAHKIRSARKSKYCSRLVLSTDDKEIQAEGIQHGAEVPFLRPAELASDDASSDDVALHAMDYVTKAGESYDAIMLLEPSTPFATPDDYDRAVEIMIEKKASMVTGIVESKHHPIFSTDLPVDRKLSKLVSQLETARSLRRQDFATQCILNGAFYLMEWQPFISTRRRYTDPDGTYGLLMPHERSVEIDEPIDLAFARYLASTGALDLSYLEAI